MHTLHIKTHPTQNVQRVLDLRPPVEAPTEDSFKVRAYSTDRWFDLDNAYARVRLMDGTLIMCRHHYKRDYAYMMFTRAYWRPDEGYTVPPLDEFSDQSWRVVWITDPVPGEKLLAAVTRAEWRSALKWESTAPVKELLG